MISWAQELTICPFVLDKPLADTGFAKRDSSKTTNEPSGAAPIRPLYDYKPSAANVRGPAGLGGGKVNREEHRCARRRRRAARRV